MPRIESARAPRLAVAALAASLASGAAEAAYTRSGNQFILSGGDVAFSLSLSPNAGGAGIYSIPQWNSAMGWSSAFRSEVFGGVTYAFLSATGPSLSAPVVGDAQLNGQTYAAPYVAPGVRYSGVYVGAGKDQGTGLWFNYAARESYVGLLVGSVSASDRFGVLLRDSQKNVYSNFIYGSDILSAATALGISGGNDGSFYLSINVLNQFRELYEVVPSSQGAPVEWVPLQWADHNVVPTQAGLTPTGTEPSGLAGTPAPITGSSPMGGAVAIAACALLGGLRRRRAMRGV